MVTPKPPTMSLAHSRTDQRSDSARPVAKAQASIRRLEAFTHQVLLGRPTKDSKTNRRISAQPNEMLGSLKPVEAIERGQIGLVWQVVEGLRSGAQL